jgi:predicted GNAT family acetyltransferase
MSEAEPVEIRNDPQSERYVATIGGTEAGAVYYERGGNQITFTHTEVSDAFGGHGVGGKLAELALDEARSAGAEVVPQCPFVAHYIARHPAYLDLVPLSLRERVSNS